MKLFLLFSGLLFSFLASATGFKCPVPTAFQSYACTGGTVRVTDQTQLNSYIANLGLSNGKIKDLVIDFNINLTSNLTISTPCSVIVKLNHSITTQDLCIHGDAGVQIQDNNVLRAANVRLESLGTLRMGINQDVQSAAYELVTKGTNATTAFATINTGANIHVTSLLMESLGHSTTNDNSTYVASSSFVVRAAGGEPAMIGRASTISAPLIDIAATGYLKIDDQITFSGNTINLVGDTCKIVDTGLVFTATNKTGNCFTRSSSPFQYTSNKAQGEVPVTVQFNASTISGATVFYWDFGDGSVETTTNPIYSHTFNSEGTFTTSMKYNKSGTTKYVAGSLQITSLHPANYAPVSVLNCTTQNLLTNCNGLSSYDVDGGALTYKFEYGDGTIVTNTSGVSSHSYTGAGLYQVKLTVTDTGSLSTLSTTTVQATVPQNVLPTASLSCTSTLTNQLNCNANGSSDSDGSIVSYKYTFDDGIVTTQSSPTAFVHTFSTSGTHSVTLLVTDNVGGQGSDSRSYVVKANTPPIAAFNCQSPTLYAIDCQSTSSDPDAPNDMIQTVSWNFGDGATATGQNNVSHQYLTGMSYPVTLTVQDGSGATTSLTKTISIRQNSAPVAQIQCTTTNLLVSCNGLSSYDFDNQSLTYKFIYGDGFSETTSGSSYHSFVTAGLSTVVLQVTDTLGATGSASTQVQPVRPPNVLPIAQVNCSSPSPHRLSCNGNGSSDSDGSISFYKYQWDDGSSDTSSNIGSTGHLFTTGGSHSITLIVTDNDGGEKSVTASFSVKEDIAPIANFSCEPNYEPLKIRCRSLATETDVGDSIVLYSWSVDGVSEGVSPSALTFNKNFSQSGNINITLAVTDTFGGVGTLTRPFTIVNTKAPTIAFQYPTGQNFSVDEDVSFFVTVSGAEPLTIANASLVVNDGVLAPSYYSFNSAADKMTVVVQHSSLLRNGTNNISFSYKNSNGLVTTSSVVYNVTDSSAPTIAISPSNLTHFTSETGSILISATDPSGVDWTTLSLKLWDVSLDPATYSRVGDKVTIDVNSGEVLAPDENKFSFSVKDKNGNLVTQEFSYYFDQSKLNFDFLPENNTAFDDTIGDVSIYPVVSEGALNWPTLKVYWNDLEIPSSSLTVTTEKVSLALDFTSVKSGVLKVTMTDPDGNLISGQSIYKLKDKLAPIVAFSSPQGAIFTNTVSPDLMITLHDSSEINASAIQLTLNGVILPSTQYSFDSTTGVIHLHLSTTYGAVVGSNTLEVSAPDVEGNLAISDYQFTISDTEAPTLAFSPVPHSSFLTNTNSVLFKVSDLSTVNWQSLRMSLNGIPVPLIYMSIQNNTVLLNFNPDFSFELGQNVLSVSISDIWGNARSTTASYILLEKQAPPIAYAPASGSHFKILNQSVVASFSNPSDVNWDSLSVKFNDSTLTSWTRSGSNLTINLSGSNAPSQGMNALSISFTNSASQSITDLAYYILDDIAPPSLAVTPEDGHLFSGQAVTLNLSASDASGINWSSLKLTLNGTTVIDQRTTVSSNVATALLTMEPGLNTFTAQVSDNTGRSTSVARSFTVQDTVGPKFKFTPTNWATFGSGSQTFTVAITDDSGVVPSSIVLSLNGQAVPASQLNWSTSDGLLTATFDQSSFKGGTNILKVRAADTLSHVSEGNVSYKYIDSVAPVLALLPESGHSFENDLVPSIRVSFIDESSIDSNNLSFTLNGAVITGTDVIVDLNNHNILVSLANHKLNLRENTFIASVSDSNGNISTATGSYALVDTLAPTVAFGSPSNTIFNDLSQSLLFTFSDLTSVDYSTLTMTLNEVAVPASKLLHSGNDVSLTLDSDFSMKQGQNVIALSIKDVSGNELAATVSYMMNDIFPASFAFSPSAGSTLTDASTSISVQVTDGSEINWSTLVIKLNDFVLPASSLSVAGDAVAINSVFRKGLNTFEIQVRDSENNLGKSTFSYVFAPETNETVAPVLALSLESGEVTTTPGSIQVTATDLSGIDMSRVRILLNGTRIPETNLTKDTVGHSILINFDESIKFIAGRNLLTAYVSDNFANVGVVSAYYDLVSTITLDTLAPVVTFSPGGGSLVNNTPTIQVFISDNKSINWNTLTISINDQPIDQSIVTKDLLQGILALQFNSTHPIPDLTTNKIKVRIADTSGNYKTASVGLNKESPSVFSVIDYADTDDSLYASACFVLNTGNVKCWGENSTGKLGNGTFDTIGDDETPASVPDLTFGEEVKQVNSSATHSCAVTVSGKLYCWGDNTYGQVGTGTTEGSVNGYFVTPQLIDVGGSVTQVSLGQYQTCVILTSGNFKCFGYSFIGTLGQYTSGPIGDNETPASIPEINMGVKVVKIVSGQLFNCLITEEGKAKCFGYPTLGQTGYGVNYFGYLPDSDSLPYLDLPGKVLSISASYFNACAVVDNGKVYCWGSNSRGQNGLGNTENIGDDESIGSTPGLDLPVAAVKVSVGGTHSCALMVNKKVICWGENGFNELGYPGGVNVGDDEGAFAYGYVNMGGDVADVIAGDYSTYAIFTDGKMKVWGANAAGLLGRGVFFDSYATVDVPANLPFVDLGNSVKTPTYLSTGSLVARFTATPYNGPAPLLVGLDASSSLAIYSTNTITSYSWDFGDGETQTTSNALTSHIFTNEGVYDVSLTVTDSESHTASFERSITVGATNNPPNAQFLISQTSGTVPFTASLDASGSFDANGTISKYYWDFGDGEVAMSTIPFTEHVFQNPGAFVIGLKVEDNSGDQAMAIPKILTVKEFNMSPVAQFLCTMKGQLVSCSATSSSDMDGTLANYKWDMGDGTIIEGADKFNISHTYSGDGDHTVSLIVTDDSGATDTLSRSVSLDSFPPLISSSTVDNVFTKNQNFTINVSVSDSNLYETKVIVNDAVVRTTSNAVINESFPLNEGKNTFIIESIDTAGNKSRVKILSNIVLDSTSPQIATIVPGDNQSVSGQSLLIRGAFNEKVSTAEIDGNPVTLATDGMSFTYPFMTSTEGPQSLDLEFSDVAGNNTSFNIRFQTLLQILHPELISVTKISDTLVKVTGAAGSVRPRINVDVAAGFFNSQSTIAGVDGSFEVTMKYFTEAWVNVTDVMSGRTDSARLLFNVDTTLAGTIQDTDGNPLPGVVVRLKNTNTPAVTTNGSGIFSFANPPTGDRQLIIDAQNVPESVIGTVKKFSVMELPVTIGSRQSNVLERVIHLAPMLMDGSETVIEEDISYNIESPQVEGASINIPANVDVSFPDGNIHHAINMTSIESSKTTVPVLDTVEPESVVALEPSGLTFSEPVQLTLANENEFPAGMQVMIYSKNSAKGTWEIDGMAKVSEDGEKIVTVEGQGITHFSEVYAAPMGLKFSQINSQDKPGIDTIGGAVSTSIDLPGYKSLGNEISAKLLYKSNWAYPTAIVTNMFDLSPNVTFITQNGVRQVAPSKDELYVKTWVIPESIDVDFITGNYHSPKMTLTGPPEKAVVSLGMDFSQQPSGVTPFVANYVIHLKHMVVRTKVSVRKGFFNSSAVIKETPAEAFPETVPDALHGQVYVQNKITSSAGRGWMIGGVQKIVNPNGSRVMIEEEEGSVSTYTVSDKIQTVAKISNGFSGVSLFGNDRLAIGSVTNNVLDLDLESGSIQPLLSAPTLLGNYNSSNVVQRHECTKWASVAGSGKVCIERGIRKYCVKSASQYTLNPSRKFVINSPSGSGFLVASENGLITNHNSGMYTKVAGALKSSPTSDTDPSFCDSSASCYNKRKLDDYHSNTCPFNPSGAGQVYDQAFVDGNSLNAKFNTIKSIAASTTSNTVAIADYGNHRVRLLNLDSNIVSTVAGNGQLEDSGDGGNSKDASIYHPQGVAYDEDGNLYVSTESGFIRKIDKSGRISHFAGNPNGTYDDEAPATEMYFQKPYGLAVDTKNSYLYVADTGNNRVVRIDMLNNLAKTVAGNGLCQIDTTTTEYGNALSSSLCSPEFVTVDSSQNLLIGDVGHRSIRRVIFADSVDGVLEYDSVAEDNSSLRKNADRTFTRTYRNGVKAYFNSNGRHSMTQDRIGRVIKNEYDTNGNLVTQIDPIQGIIRYNYGSNGKISNIEYDVDQRQFDFAYNSSGDLTQVSYPDGSQKHFNYTTNGLLAEEIDQRNFSTTYGYNSWNRLASVNRPDGKNITFIDSQVASLANSYTTGQPGQLKKYGNGTGQLVDGIKDANNVTTTFAKDESGYVNTIVDGAGRITTVNRDLKGRPTRIIRPDDSVVDFVYDQKTGDLLKKTDSSTSTTESYQYNEYGQLLSKTDGLGRTITNDYDDHGLLERSTNETLGTSTFYEYNSIGLMIRQTNSLGQTSSVSYDARGNIQIATNPDGKSIQFSYYPTGLVHTNTDANNQSTSYEYTVMNQLSAVVTPKNERTQYGYLASGELSVIVNPFSKETHFVYDSIGQLIKKTGTRGEIVQLSYDGNGNVLTETTPRGDLKQYQYNSLNQLIAKVLPDDSYNFTYDIRGNLETVSNSATAIQFEYQHSEGGDVVSRVNSQGVGQFSDLPASSMSYVYNEVGDKIQTQSPVGNFSYQRDAAGRLTGLTNHKGKQFNFRYDVTNRLIESSSPAAVTSYEFDSTGFNTKINHARRSGATIERFIYGRDQVGNRVSKSALAGNSSYSYDQQYQLVSATNPVLPGESFSYDQIGNRTQDASGSYVYDASKQELTEDFKYLYSYDANGNMTSKQEKGFTGNVEQFGFSSENRLRTFKLFKNGQLAKDVSYVYDALGRRVEKLIVDHEDSAKSFIRRFIYDGNEILAEYDASNSLLTSYTHSTLRTDDPLSLSKASGELYFVKDGLGSITDITDESGFKVQHYEYSSFGKLALITDGSGNDITLNPVIEPFLTYTGREYDRETGLYYYRARMYDPGMGRFLSVDPDKGSSIDPASFVSQYVYVENNVINSVDPRGRRRGILNKAMNYIGTGIDATKAIIRSREFKAALGATIGAVEIVVGVAISPVSPNLGAALIVGGAGFIAGAAIGYFTPGQDPLATSFRYGVYANAVALAAATGVVLAGAEAGALTTFAASYVGALAGHKVANFVGAKVDPTTEYVTFGASTSGTETKPTSSGGAGKSSTGWLGDWEFHE